MVNRTLIRGLDANVDDVVMPDEDIIEYLGGDAEIELNQILDGVVVRIEKEFVIVDVGYKSEGAIPVSEWEEGEETPKPGDHVKVLVEELEDAMTAEEVQSRGMIVLSKRKAAKIESWMRMMERVKEGDVVDGVVSKKIKGGLLVDIGVNVFLPASQVDIRRPTDINEFIGKPIKCVILKIDEARRNIVVSRRELIEQERKEKKTALLNELQVGQIREGTVKNIAEFGAFIDLGGIDGLLHITDMSWGRITDPKELVSIGQELEVMVLDIDRERERIALGLKQTMNNPWESVDTKYPVGAKVKGVVRNLTNYGAFVELEEGVDGLLHISDMSWVRKITHPSEVVKKNEEIECVVTQVDKKNRRIALGLKQLTEDPWATRIPEKYRPNQIVKGKVTKITSFGVFVSLEDDLEGLLHISELADHKVENPEEVVKVGEEIEVMVLRVDSADRKIGLSRKRAEKGDEEPVEEAPEPTPAVTIKQPKELKGGMGGDSGPLFQLPGQN